MPNKEPIINIPESELEQAGFTTSGKERYQKTVTDYSKTLFDKAINYAEIDKAQIREVTHDHVKAAAHSIANSFGKPSTPWWMWFVRLGQYAGAIGVGVATNHLDTSSGAIGFAVAVTVGVILLYIESLKK